MGPANPDPNDLLSRSYFRPVLTPGSSITETVTVSNTGDVPVDLYVYPVDGLTGTTSGTVYANRADPRQKAGTWLTATVSSLTVPADHVQEVPCRIDVPATAAPGDHVAGIAFENAHPTHASGFSVTEVIREVIGVQVRVPGPGQFRPCGDAGRCVERAGHWPRLPRSWRACCAGRRRSQVPPPPRSRSATTRSGSSAPPPT